MIKIVDKKNIELVDNIRDTCDYSKVLIVDIDMSDMENLKGRYYAVSDNKEDEEKLYEMRNHFQDNNSIAMVVGSYNNWGDVSDLYE